MTSNGDLCYSTSSVSNVFPNVSLKFAGGAIMNLRPQDYLLQQKMDADEVWCLGIKRNNYKDQRLNILGDIVLKDKIFVYDLGGQRIGWAERNCSSIVYVSTSSGSSSPLQITSYEVIPALVLAFVVHLTVVRW